MRIRRALFLSLVSLALCDASRISAIHRVRPGDAEKLLAQGDVLLLDVRTLQEFQTGHIPGARLYPMLGFSKRLKELPSDKTVPVLVTCDSGSRSSVAAKMLVQNGYKDVYVLSGGLRAWMAEKKPVQKPPLPRTDRL